MRNLFSDRLIDLKSKVTQLNARYLACLHTFKDRNHINDDDMALLERYHQRVFSWVNEWQRSFFESIRIESAFEEADLSDERFLPIIKRKSFELKTYLLLHSRFLPFGIVDFTDTPFMLVHVVLLFAAQAIVTDDTSACQLLMPWVQSVRGVADEKNIKAATEEVSGVFKPWRYISGKDRRSLYAIVDELDYVNAIPERAEQFFTSDNRAYLKKKMSDSLENPYLNYIRALEYFYHKVALNPAVFSYHVHRLSTVLHERSKRRKGNEFFAGDESTSDIQNFRVLWLGLDKAVRETLSAATIQGERLNFGEYLILIFATSQDVVLTQDELLVAAKHANVLRCAAVLSSVLSDFVYQHKEWAECPVDVTQQETAPDIYSPEEIPQLRQIFVDALDDYEARFSSNSDSLMSAIHPASANLYDRFFFIAGFLPLFTDETLGVFQVESQVGVFHSQDAVLLVLKQIEAMEQRNEFFRLFEADIKVHFRTVSDVVLLMHFFDLSLFQEMAKVFDSQIASLYRVSQSKAPFFKTRYFLGECKKQGIHFSMEMLYSLTVHMLRQDNPSRIITGMTQLLSCFMFCQTQEACDTLFELAEPLIDSLLAPAGEKKKGAALLRFIQLFQSDFKDVLNSAVDASLLLQNCVVFALSNLLTQEFFEPLWEKASQTTSRWCACFSSKVNAHDRSFYEAFSASEEREERVRLLLHFVVANKGERFLNALKEAFDPSFFVVVPGLVMSSECVYAVGSLTL